MAAGTPARCDAGGCNSGGGRRRQQRLHALAGSATAAKPALHRRVRDL